MEARMARAAIVAAAALSLGAGYRTENFIVQAPTAELAREIGDAAEQFRRDLAIQWLGKEMPAWGQPCMLTATVSPQMGAGGATSFVFDQGQVFGWRMTIQGSRQRILDSVLPHEVTHTVFATHFRQPLPRWADEGACTTVEHPSERGKQERMLITFLKTGRGISFSQMFAMKDYPQDIMPLYSQGYSLARFLLAQRDKQTFLTFLADGMNDENWPRALRKHYGFADMLTLQNTWLEWVKRGSPDVQLASSSAPASGAAQGKATIRGQSPDTVAASTGRMVPVPQTRRAETVAAATEGGWRATGSARTRPAARTASFDSGGKSVYQRTGQVQSARLQPVQKSQQVVIERDQTAGPAPAMPAVRQPIRDASLGGRVIRR